MRKLYYISKSKQKLKQFEYLKPKSILIYAIIVSFLLIISWGTFTLISTLTSSSQNIASLEAENVQLRNRISSLTRSYKNLDKEFKNLRTEANYLRLAVNLPPLSQDEATLGIGGSEFETSFKLSNSSLKNLDGLVKYVESLELKLRFEKSEHQLISDKLKKNEALYASIPALKPCEGLIGVNGFGMREHPILRINKIHEGIDIITDVGTKVLCTGNGVVSFVGIRGGYGLTVELEHQSGFKTVYAHLLGVLVKEGQKVNRGTAIALTGNSGLSTGPHLHYEVHHDGIKLDPSQFFFDDLALFEPKNKK